MQMNVPTALHWSRACKSGSCRVGAAEWVFSDQQNYIHQLENFGVVIMVLDSIGKLGIIY